MRFFIKVLVLSLCLIANNFSFAAQTKKNTTNKRRKLSSLESIYKSNHAGIKGRKLIDMAKKLNKSSNTVIVAVIGFGIYYKNLNYAHKVLRPEDSKLLSEYVEKSSGRLVKDCAKRFEANEGDYDMVALRREILGLRNILYSGYRKNFDVSAFTSYHDTFVSSELSRASDNILILPMGTFSGRNSEPGITTDLAVDLAVKQGAKIVLFTSGKNSNHPKKQRIFCARYKKIMEKYPGILFVIAAGNEGMDINNSSYIDFDLPNVIVVGAVDSYFNLTDYSNYGSNVVDVAARSLRLLDFKESDNPGYSRYAKEIFRGTSYTAPHVAGLAANMMYIDPRLSAKRAKSIICETVNKRYDLEQAFKCGGYISTQKAIEVVKREKKFKKKKRRCRGRKMRHVNPECFLDIFEDEYLLFLAVAEGYENLVQFYIDQGVDVNGAKDDFGLSMLIFAAKRGHEEVVKKLISAGADLDYDDYGYTALCTASEENHVGIVEALVAAGADLSKKTETGYTALEIAYLHGHEEVIRILEDAYNEYGQEF